MKIRFMGMLEKTKKGCPVCGKRTTTESGYTAMKTYILPSGVTKVFRAGKVEEVSDNDAEFLLQYKFTDKEGKVRQVFEVVNDG